VEANPLIRVIAQTAGEVVVVVFKLALVGTALAIMWYLFRRTRHALSLARDRSDYSRAMKIQIVIGVGTMALVAFYVWVIQHNVRVVWG
jgi:hypothetical protein